MEPLDLALLVLRLGVAYVFLCAAWGNLSTPEARRWARDETALLLRPFGIPPAHGLNGVCMMIGMAMMVGGGIALLLGAFPRVGGLAIALFSLMGIRIHLIRQREALALAHDGVAIAWSAFGAHIAAGLKNWALAAAGIFFAIAGTGRLSLGPDPFTHLVARMFT